jgi:hypothetical protein
VEKFVETSEGDINLCYGLRLANETIYSVFVGYLFNGESSFYRNSLIDGLSCSLGRTNLWNFLELALDAGNNLTLDERNTMIARVSSSSVKGMEASLDFLYFNMWEINKK